MTTVPVGQRDAVLSDEKTGKSEKGDWNVHSRFYVLEGSTKREIRKGFILEGYRFNIIWIEMSHQTANSIAQC